MYFSEQHIIVIMSLQPLSLVFRWMENVSLEVIATCGQPPELRGQSIRDVSVFTSCPESAPPPGEEVTVDHRPPEVKKPKPSLSNSHRVKANPAKPKAKKSKPTKNQPQRKPAAPKVTSKETQ